MVHSSAVKDESDPAKFTKRSLYFPGGMLDEIRVEAKRLDRGVSWVVQRAWRLARDEIRRIEPRTDE
jgi:uncharacterized small protein (TIGR04563 family)